MMHKIIAALRKVKSKLSLAIVGWVVLLIFTLLSLKQINNLYPPAQNEDIPTILVSQINIAEEVSKPFGFKKNEGFFSPGLPPINNTLCVNTSENQLVFKPSPQSQPSIIEYEKISSTIREPKETSQQTFDSLIRNGFNLPEFDQLLTKGNNISSAEIHAVGNALGAKNEYIEKIIQAGKNDIRTIILSLIYNTILSGPSGTIVSLIENKKLKALNTGDYKVDFVNEKKLVESINRLSAGESGGKAAFIEREYKKLQHSEEVNTEETQIDLQKSLDKVFGEKTIRLNTVPPLDFTYINFKDDVFYCGSYKYRYDPVSYLPRDDAPLETLFKDQFALGVYTELTTEEIAKQIGIEEANANLIRPAFPWVSNSEWAFSAIISFLLSHPEPYAVVNGRLYPLSKINSDSVAYGKFNHPMLQKGIADLSKNLDQTGSFTIVKKKPGAVKLLSLTVILLFVSFTVLLSIYSYYRRKRRVEKTEPVLTGDIQEQLKAQQEIHDTQLQTAQENLLKKTVLEISNYLTQAGLELSFPAPKLQEARDKIAFYDAVEKSKTSAKLIKVVDKERGKNAKIPPIESANDVFEKADNQQTEIDAIMYLMTKFDEFSEQEKDGMKSLKDTFDEMVQAKRGNDKLNSLLSGNNQHTFYDYLKSEIEKTENNPSLESFVHFGSLFKSAKQKKFKSEAEILKEYNQINTFIESFYQKARQLHDPKLLERTAILCWSLELTSNLLQIKNTPVNIDIEKVKNDQLQLISTRYFLRIAGNPDKTERDFEISLEESKQRIADYNSKIADQTAVLRSGAEHDDNINALTELMRKIKKYDSTELVFRKLYDHFVKEFNSKIENLRFTKEDLNAEDRSWLFQYLFNITFHVADYTEHFIRNDDEMYHFNFQFLKNDFDLGKTEHRAFVENDREQSNNLSNSVAKAARFAGVKKLDLLLNKYYITPEQLI